MDTILESLLLAQGHFVNMGHWESTEASLQLAFKCPTCWPPRGQTVKGL